MTLKRILGVLTVVFAAFGVRAATDLAAAETEFMTSDELCARLKELYCHRNDGVVSVISHADRGYHISGPFTPYEYRCPICGKSTWYHEKILIGTGIDIGKYLAWGRATVAELRALRLDIRMDERTLCATCRKEFMIPDGGEIVRIPEVWPGWRDKRDVFPFKIGEKVRILAEPFANVFGVVRWDQASSERTIEPPSLLSSCCIRVPKEAVGNLTYAGEGTSRTDIFTPRWTINGKRVRMWEGDEVLLRRFLTGVSLGADDMSKYIRRKRLAELLNPEVDEFRPAYWIPEPYRGDDGEIKCHPSVCPQLPEVKVDVDI